MSPFVDEEPKTLYIRPGSPRQKSFIESFRSCFRAECLDRGQLLTLFEGHVVIEGWQRECQGKRPLTARSLTSRRFSIDASSPIEILSGSHL